ncbi:MAG: glycosyltransferase family 4 protein [Patescibacteria group bacterium]
MIVHVVPYLNEYGGIQTFAKDVRRLLKDEFDIQALDFSFPESHLRFLLQSKILWRKEKIIQDAKLIHFWQPLSAIGFENTNYIVSCHGKEILPSNLKAFEKRALRNVFKRAQAIQVNSKFTRKILFKYFPGVSETKVKLIYPGVAIRGRKVYKHSKLTIGTLTRFNPRKNVPNIIKALDILAENLNTNFRYILVGSGEEEKIIRRELAKAKFPWQHIKNMSDEKKWASFYPKLNIFALPTLSLGDDLEGFGIVYLEANSFGIPVVASKVDGVKESVKENVSGIFTNPHDPKSIAEAVYRLIKERRRYERSTRIWAKQFSLEKMSSEFRDLYKQYE